jgi:hypothetical protein
VAEQSPKYLNDVEKWRGSLSIQRMSFAERGVYKEMLNEQWLSPERSLPDDPHQVADLIAPTPAHVAEVLAAWDVVRRKFVLCRRQPGRIYNIKLEKIRREQRNAFRSRSHAGRIAGKASAAKRWTDKRLVGNESLTTVERSSTEGKGKERKGEEGIGEERKKRPRFSGQRIAVFDWLHDKLRKILGPNADAFRLDDWYRELDERAVRSLQVIPSRDGGQWLEAQLLAEVRRRGFSIDDGTPAELTCPHDPPCSAPGRWACQQKTATEAYKASQKATA